MTQFDDDGDGLPTTMIITPDMPRVIFVYEGVPAWLVSAVERLRPLVGLEEWHVWLICNPALEAAGKVMHVEYKPEALEARIQIGPTVENNTTGRRAILHELLHLALAPLTRVGEQLVETQPKPSRRFAAQMLVDAEEIVIERLVRRITPLLLPDGPEDAA